MLGTTQKAGYVLDLFTRGRHEWSVVDIATELTIPSSSAHRLLSSLADTGLLECWRGKYRIGWRVFALAEIRRREIETRSIFTEEVEGLAQAVGFTAYLVTLRGWKPVCQAVAHTAGVLAIYGPGPGGEIPLFTSAVGRTLLAQRQPSDLLRFISNNPRLNEASAPPANEHPQLISALNDARAKGFAEDLGETTPDIACLAAPVQTSYSTCAPIAVGVAVPSATYVSQRELVRNDVLATARKISMELIIDLKPTYNASSTVDDGAKPTCAR